MSMTISKRKRPRFSDQPQMTPATSQKEKKNISSKELAEAQKNLQLLVRDTVCNGHYANTTIIASSVVSDDEVLPAKANGGAEILELLNWTEEADSRLVLHVEWAVRVKQCQRVVVLSNDTYTFALLLHYAPYLQTQGLKELWQ